MKWLIWGVIFILLFTGSLLIAGKARMYERLRRLLQRGREGMEEVSRQRLLENRRRLLSLQQTHSFWYRVEEDLQYSGWRRRFPSLTAERFLAVDVCGGILVFLLAVPWLGWIRGLIAAVTFWGVWYAGLCICKIRALRSVNKNLLKFLDFLGNYSITAGELTGIFKQISKYVDEPLRTVLDECSYEAQTTGDSSMALLVMAEKIEHPKFKELARNMEISVRYCADFTTLVQNSRKNMREYLRMSEERKSLVREAAVNMLLLLGMSVVTLLVVDQLIETSIWTLLYKTWPGRIALGVVLFILLLFAGKVSRIHH
ncbi:MAG: hypothetical protein IJ747_04810 [Lachnospiraceae bacterium]|nr:hypothetical protein [Lachnospiraceae bacterium]